MIDALEKQVESNSGNKRKLIATMLYQQRQKGRVIKRGKRNCLVPEGGGHN